MQKLINYENSRILEIVKIFNYYGIDRHITKSIIINTRNLIKYINKNPNPICESIRIKKFNHIYNNHLNWETKQYDVQFLNTKTPIFMTILSFSKYFKCIRCKKVIISYFHGKSISLCRDCLSNSTINFVIPGIKSTTRSFSFNFQNIRFNN